MSMLDSQLIFAENQTATDHTQDTPSTNVLDFGSAQAGDLSLTDPHLWVQAIVETTVTSAGAATIAAVLQDSADNVTFTDVLAGPAIAKANATAGSTLLLAPLPPMREYHRVVWRIGTADLTAGAFSAYYISNPQANKAPTPRYTVA